MLACMLLMIMTALVADGRVFLRWGAAKHLARFVAGIGGKLAYSADLSVNGADANIAVYGLPEAHRPWGNSARSISYKQDNQKTTLTGLHLSGNSLLLQYQRQDTKAAAPKHRSSLPRFPQSKQVFYAHDETADMSVSISRSRAAPAQVRNYYEGSMQAAGWHLPAVSKATPPAGMTMFIRKQEVACIGIEQLPQHRETRITLLHKKLRIK